MTNKELAQMLKDGLEDQDIDTIWFVIGELEK
jgi:hypothetical protein